MDTHELCASFLSVLIVIVSLYDLSSAQHYSVNLTLSVSTASVGDDLTAVCNIRNEASTRLIVYWVRKIPGHEHDHSTSHETEIALTGYVNDAYRNTGRYTAKTEIGDEEFKSFRSYLNITDLKTEDSGRIGCRVTGPEKERSEKFEDFVVAVPVQKVQWESSEPNSTSPLRTHTDGTTIELQEGQIRRFVCRVSGSYPKPEVRIFIGERDITSHFKHHPVLVRGEGIAGFQSLYYKVEVSHDALKVDYSFNEKPLRCVASLPRNHIPLSADASMMQKSSTINISLQYKPKFHCGPEVFIKINEPNYNLVCVVHANPEVRVARVSWNETDEAANDTIDTLQDGMKIGDYEANITATNDYETVMVLTISRVYKQHFKAYYFEAKNDIGHVVHVIELKEALTESISSGASSTITSFTHLAVLQVLAVVIGLVRRW